MRRDGIRLFHEAHDLHRRTGNALAAEFKTAWEAGGGKVGISVPYNPEANSLDSEAGKLADGNIAAATEAYKTVRQEMEAAHA